MSRAGVKQELGLSTGVNPPAVCWPRQAHSASTSSTSSLAYVMSPLSRPEAPFHLPQVESLTVSLTTCPKLGRLLSVSCDMSVVGSFSECQCTHTHTHRESGSGRL